MDRGAWKAAVHGVAEGRTRLNDFTFIFHLHVLRRKWQPTPVFLPGESHGRGSLVGCCLWGRTVRHDWSDSAAAAAAVMLHMHDSVLLLIYLILLLPPNNCFLFHIEHLGIWIMTSSGNLSGQNFFSLLLLMILIMMIYYLLFNYHLPRCSQSIGYTHTPLTTQMDK